MNDYPKRHAYLSKEILHGHDDLEDLSGIVFVLAVIGILLIAGAVTGVVWLLFRWGIL